MSTEIHDEIISKWLKVFCWLYRTAWEQEIYSAWCQTFKRVHPEILEMALERTRDEVERFPTPAHVMKRVREIYDQRRVSTSSYEDDHRYDFLSRRRYDENGVECRIDPDGVKHYRAKDCEEGRLFLQQLKEMAARVEMPRVDKPEQESHER